MSQHIEIDLSQYPAEKRAEIYAKSKAAGFKILNPELAGESALPAINRPQKALSLDFPGDMPPVTQAKEYFRVSMRKGFDILFDGLPISPAFNEPLEAIAKVKYANEADPHVACHVFAAFAFPIDSSASKYRKSIVNPSAMNRVLPQKLRVHMGIEAHYYETGSRADAVWYKMAQVSNQQELVAFQQECERIALETQVQCCAGAIDKWMPPKE